ncbi:MAG: sulfotransferase [Planctomycetes bacterium]|nr:sulfotransferase [Planctomycetota bacterium]
MNDELPWQLERPIVVIGSPRSGTTLLGNLLSEHPALVHLVEPRLTWKYGNDSKSDMLQVRDARPEVCRHIRSTFAKAVQDAGGKRLLEKTPSNALRMEFVDRVLPGCLFVHILRDGVESVLSIRGFWQRHARGFKKGKISERLREINLRRAPYYFKELVRRAMPQRLSGLVGQPVWGPRIPGIDGLLQDLSVLEVCCLQWRMSVEAACHYGRQLPADRYMECRLEKMSPELLESVLKFCQLSMTPEVRTGFDTHFDKGLTTRRRDQADLEVLRTIQKWIGPTMQWLGQENPQGATVA